MVGARLTGLFPHLEAIVKAVTQTDHPGRELLKERPGQTDLAFSVEVYPGNTSDPSTLASQIFRVRERWAIERVIWVADRGLLTEARIEDLATLSKNRMRFGQSTFDQVTAPTAVQRRAFELLQVSWHI